MALVAIQQIRPAHAEPGDIFTTAAPAAGTAPPTATPIPDGDASVSPSGALKYGYPIQVPPGRLGMQPHLSLSYSSDAPIYGGIAAGWSLSGIPIITLDTSQGRLLGRTFQSSMAGGRPLVSVDEGYGAASYRAQNDSSWVRYMKMPSGSTYPWKALAPDGTTYYFGDQGTSDAGGHTAGCSNIDDEYAPLTRVSDSFGNVVEYFYAPGVAGECRIDHVTWGQNAAASVSEFARVTFSYNDPAPACAGVPVGSLTSYRSGKPIVTGGSELTAITATAYEPGQYNTPEHTRVITLTYSSTDKACTVNHGAFRSLLSIQESAYFGTSVPPDPTATVLPPVTFTYGDVNLQYPTPASHALPWPLGPVSGVDGFALSSGLRPHAGGEWPTVEDMLLDVDGDGLVDRIVNAPAPYNQSTNTPVQCRAKWFKNLGNLQFDTQARYIDLPTLKWGHDLSDQSDIFSGGGAPGVYPGETDWERCALNYQSTAFVNSFYDDAADCPAGGICTNGTCPNGTDCPAPLPASASSNGHSHTYLSYRWMDLNGDGLVDLVAGVAQGGLALYNLQRGNGIPGGPIPEPTDEPQIFGAFPSCPPNPAGGYLARGTYTMCKGLYPWFVYFNHGNGVFGKQRIRVDDPLLPDEIKYQPIPLETDQGDSSLTSWPNGETRGLVDLDGDGRVDATVAPSSLTPSAFAMFRSSTTGTFGPDPSSTPFAYYAGPNDLLTRTDCTTFGSCWPVGTQGLLDINGDGLADHWTIGADPTTATVDFNDGVSFASALQSAPLSARPGTDWIREVWSTPCSPNTSCSVIDSGARTLTSRVLDMDGDGRGDVLQIVYPGHCQLGGQACTTTQASCANGDTCTFPLTSPFATDYNQGGQFCSINCGPIANGAPVNALANVIVVGGIDPGWYWEARADLVDLDGDGIPDSVDFDGTPQSEPPATNPHSLYLSKIATPTQPARLLATIDNHRGATTTVAYATSTSPTVEQHPELGRTLPQVHWVVQSLSTVDAIASTTTTTGYHYVNPEYIPDDRGTYGFRGFGEIQTTLPSGAIRVDRYDFATDWSGRLKTSLVIPAEAPGDVRSIDETQWQALTLFSGVLTTYHPQYVDHWTCMNGQDEEACRENTDARTRTAYFYDAPMASSTDPGAPLLWVANRVRLQAAETEADGDRETQSLYWLAADDQDNYRLLPWSETHSSQVSGALVMFAKTAHTFDHDYKVTITDKVWTDDNELDAAVTMRLYDPNTGNLLQRWKPEQFAANSYPAYYTYDSRQLFVAHEKSEPVGYPTPYTRDFIIRTSTEPARRSTRSDPMWPRALQRHRPTVRPEYSLAKSTR